jgi:hypothetical protein
MRPLTRPFFAIALFASCHFSLSCGGANSGSSVEPETPRPANISISPSNPTLEAEGASVQFTATVRDQLGREMVGESVVWNTSEPSVGTISSSGLATAVGDGSATIIATASGSVSGWATLSVTIVEVTITTASLPHGVEGEAYSQTLEAEGSTSYQWSIIDGTLPPGLALDPATGVIGGTPTLLGEYPFTVQLTASSQTLTRELAITIASGLLGTGFGDDQFVLIEAGTFQMGSANGGNDELPVHAVNITKPFYMQKTEVTQRQWLAVMGSNPSALAACGELCPVENVSWNDIQIFLTALNAVYPEANYRLPTEAEWEYAARAGSTGDYGGTGNLDEMGWYSENSGTKTHFVGLKNPNTWGLYDTHGNVYEWVQDLYSSSYYEVSPTDDPTGPVIGSDRLLRGGSEDQNAAHARSANRYDRPPSFKSYVIVGFRLARTP